MFAVITTGGKQYIVKQGNTLKVEKLLKNEGEEVIFDKVHLVVQEDGKDLKLGKPYLDGKKITANVLAQGRSKKISVIKYKPKTRYRRKIGHRQPYTQLAITSIS